MAPNTCVCPPSHTGSACETGNINIVAFDVRQNTIRYFGIPVVYLLLRCCSILNYLSRFVTSHADAQMAVGHLIASSSTLHKNRPLQLLIVRVFIGINVVLLKLSKFPYLSCVLSACVTGDQLHFNFFDLISLLVLLASVLASAKPAWLNFGQHRGPTYSYNNGSKKRQN